MTDLTISAKAIGIKELQTILRESDKKLLRSTQRHDAQRRLLR
jgi:hypothetical protein